MGAFTLIRVRVHAAINYRNSSLVSSIGVNGGDDGDDDDDDDDEVRPRFFVFRFVPAILCVLSWYAVSMSFEKVILDLDLFIANTIRGTTSASNFVGSVDVYLPDPSPPSNRIAFSQQKLCGGSGDLIPE
ncbi:hypothetical protein HOY80DRAFT_1001716 [Tuber brumale]|nr:hypothetical protein HOY80DRAFT_1001716 [Tuber brumale]